MNPIAGMGGAVGLKGTDGKLLEEALKRGAKPVAPLRARRFLERLSRAHFKELILSAAGAMGCDYLSEYPSLKFNCLDIPTSSITRSHDTKEACKRFINEGVKLIVFVGGDGTARDIFDVVNSRIPILGIPAGVKMYSGVFAASPEAAAEVLVKFVEGSTSVEMAEIADADESAISRGELRVRIYGYALTPFIEGFLIPSKEFSSGDFEEKLEVAEFFVHEIMEKNALYILGPGSTIKAIADILNVDKTLLGVDAVYNGKLVGKDLGEKELLDLISKYSESKRFIVVTVIGRQGYIFGRGNQQISPEVIRRVGIENIYIVATRSKLANLKWLLVDTGDTELDKKLSGYRRVIIGYNEEKVMRVVPASYIENFLED